METMVAEKTDEVMVGASCATASLPGEGVVLVGDAVVAASSLGGDSVMTASSGRGAAVVANSSADGELCDGNLATVASSLRDGELLGENVATVASSLCDGELSGEDAATVASSPGDGELLLSPETAALLVGELDGERTLLGERDAVAAANIEVVDSVCLGDGLAAVSDEILSMWSLVVADIVAPELSASIHEPESVELRLDAPVGGDDEASSVDREGMARDSSFDGSGAESSSSSPGSSSNSSGKPSSSSYAVSDEEVDILTVDGEEDGVARGSEFAVGDEEVEIGAGGVKADVEAGGGDDVDVVSRTKEISAAKEDDVIVIDDCDEVFEEAVVADRSRRHGRGKDISVAARVLNDGNLARSSHVSSEKEKPTMLILPLHPEVSYPSMTTVDTLRWVAENSCRNGVPEMRLPTSEERPWTTPPGWMCVYDAWFWEYHLWFPLPELLLLYCARRQISISQLCPVSIRNVVACLLLAAEAGVEMDILRFEQMVSITRNSRTAGTFYVSMKGGLALVTEEKSKIHDWIRNFFYIRSSCSSISDGRRIRSRWNQYHVRHVAGIQGWRLVDSAFKKDLEKILSVGNRKWKLVDRQRIARSFVRIDSDPCPKRMGKVDMQFPDYYGSRYGSASGEGQVAAPPPTAPAAPSVVVALPNAADAFIFGRAGRVERSSGGSDGPSSARKTASAAGKRVVPPVRTARANQLRKRPAGDRPSEDAPLPKVRRAASPPPAADEPPLYAFDFSYASSDRFITNSGECARLCKLVHDHLDEDMPAVEYDPDLEELYEMYSRHLMKSLSFSNKMLLYVNHKMRLAREAWETEKDEEVKKLREDLEAEKQKVLVARADVQRLSDKNIADAAAAKKILEDERDRLRCARSKEIKKYEGLSALYVARGRKMEKFVAEQPVIRDALFELNQVKGILGVLRPLRAEGVLIPEEKIRTLEKDEIELDAKARALDVITFEDGELTRIPSVGPPAPARPPSLRSSTVAPARPSAPAPKSSARPSVPRPSVPAPTRLSAPVPKTSVPASARSSDGARDVDVVPASAGAADPVVDGS